MHHCCNTGWETEAQILMSLFMKDSVWESDTNFSPVVFQKGYFSFCSGFLGVTLSNNIFLFDYYFQKCKGRNSDMSASRAPIVFNCTASRQGSQNKIRKRKKRTRHFCFLSHHCLTGFTMSLVDGHSYSYSKKILGSVQVSTCITFVEIPLETSLETVCVHNKSQERGAKNIMFAEFTLRVFYFYH